MWGSGALFSSPVVGRRCVGLGVACTFDVLLTGYGATLVDGAVAHVGVVMIHLRGCSEQGGPSVVVNDEAMIDVSKTIWF